MSRKPKEPVKPVNSFYCVECDQTMEGPAALKQHLADVHKITEAKGTRKMTLHLDCADSYTSQFEVTLGGLKFIQTTVNPRRGR